MHHSFFVHFFAAFARLQRANASFAFYREHKQEPMKFISLSERGYGPFEFIFRRVRLHLTK